MTNILIYDQKFLSLDAEDESFLDLTRNWWSWLQLLKICWVIRAGVVGAVTDIIVHDYDSQTPVNWYPHWETILDTHCFFTTLSYNLASH